MVDTRQHLLEKAECPGAIGKGALFGIATSKGKPHPKKEAKENTLEVWQDGGVNLAHLNPAQALIPSLEILEPTHLNLLREVR